MRSKARAGCPVCALPREVRLQLGRAATRKGFTREDQLEWLRECHGMPRLTLAELALHSNGRHDAEEADAAS